MEKEKGKTVVRKTDLKLRIYSWVLLLIRMLEKLPHHMTADILVRDSKKISRIDSTTLLEELDQISRMLATSIITLRKK